MLQKYLNSLFMSITLGGDFSMYFVLKTGESIKF